MEEIRILSPTGVCGSGFIESSFEKALSKNAGPFELTFDIMFDDEKTYERVKRSGAVSREVVARCYGLAPADVKFFYCDNARAIKASIPRPVFQGDPRDSDGHGGQQYAPLMDIEIP